MVARQLKFLFSVSNKQYLLYLVYSFSHIVVPLEYKIFV